MKMILTLCLLFAALSAQAGQNGALKAVKELFQEGIYFGFTPGNGPCTLAFKYSADRAEITATSDLGTVKRTVVDGTAYRFNAGRREFLSSDRTGTFRTLAVDEAVTYTVTAAPAADGEFAIECITNTAE